MINPEISDVTVDSWTRRTPCLIRALRPERRQRDDYYLSVNWSVWPRWAPTYLHDIIPAEVEGPQGGGVAEAAGGETPDVVVWEVQQLQLREPLEGLGLQLHGHAAGPLAVVSPDDQLPQVLQAHKGGGREEFDLAELDGEFPQLRLSPELVRLHHWLVEVNIRADHGQSVGILNLGNQIERMLIHVRHVTILGSVYIAIRISGVEC